MVMKGGMAMMGKGARVGPYAMVKSEPGGFGGGFGGKGGAPQGGKPGDWICPTCGDLQFARNQTCRMCGPGMGMGAAGKGGNAMQGQMGQMMAMMGQMMGGAGGMKGAAKGGKMGGAPKGLGKHFAGEELDPALAGHANAKPGDWLCPACGDLVFARNTNCRKCGADQQGNPGAPGWEAGGKKGGKGSASPESMMQQMMAMMMGVSGKGKGKQPVVNNQEEKPGDWYCPVCGDLQFARNTSCRNCSRNGLNPMAFFGGKGGKSNEVKGENLVYVGNLSYKVRWQELKDHMKQCGSVEFCRVLTEDGTDTGWSKGTGCVRYSTPEEVEMACQQLNETELMGRNILVGRWNSGAGKSGKGA